jgi:DnaJ-class molecular chaperone
MCHGSCSVGRYVLPNVVALVECSSCKGTGDAPATKPTADQGPAIQVHCPRCGAVPGNACRSTTSGGFVLPHTWRKRVARELFGDGVDT